MLCLADVGHPHFGCFKDRDPFSEYRWVRIPGVPVGNEPPIGCIDRSQAYKQQGGQGNCSLESMSW